jgi:hypothetical protein
MFERHYHRQSGAFSVKVEPHSGLGQAVRYRVDADGLWERSVPLSRFGITDWGDAGRALSAEDNLAHLFLHQANAVFDEIDLRSPLDLHELVSQWRPDWDRVLGRARAWRVVTPMYLALSAARALFGTPVPAEVIRAVRPGGIRRAWLARFIDSEGLGLYLHAEHPHWLKRIAVGFGSMDRPGDAIRYAFSYAGQRVRDPRRSLEDRPTAPLGVLGIRALELGGRLLQVLVDGSPRLLGVVAQDVRGMEGRHERAPRYCGIARAERRSAPCCAGAFSPANAPSAMMTRGRMIAICSKRKPSHAAISSGSGSRFPGGRHLMMFAM